MKWIGTCVLAGFILLLAVFPTALHSDSEDCETKFKCGNTKLIADGKGISVFNGTITDQISNRLVGIQATGKLYSQTQHALVARAVNSGEEGTAEGVYASAAGYLARGVYGVANSPFRSVGVDGFAGSNKTQDHPRCVGVNGRARHASPGYGVYGTVHDSDTGYGVYGYAYDNSSISYGVFGTAEGTGDANYGIYGRAKGAATNFAGYFDGNVHVGGTFSKGAGSFKIDHPLDPENKYLNHSFVESPDMMNIYNGNVITDGNGDAVVQLPEYFSALNRDFRYQLTVIGQFAQAIVSEEISQNRFAIKTDKPRVKVSWQVTGTRKDAFAEKNRIKVEVDKVLAERGKYLHPEAFGLGEEHGLRSVIEIQSVSRAGK